jgi:hypothetical protein
MDLYIDNRKYLDLKIKPVKVEGGVIVNQVVGITEVGERTIFSCLLHSLCRKVVDLLSKGGNFKQDEIQNMEMF